MQKRKARRKPIEPVYLLSKTLFPSEYSETPEVDRLCKRGDLSFSEKITKLDEILNLK